MYDENQQLIGGDPDSDADTGIYYWYLIILNCT